MRELQTILYMNCTTYYYSLFLNRDFSVFISIYCSAKIKQSTVAVIVIKHRGRQSVRIMCGHLKQRVGRLRVKNRWAM